MDNAIKSNRYNPFAVRNQTTPGSESYGHESITPSIGVPTPGSEGYWGPETRQPQPTAAPTRQPQPTAAPDYSGNSYYFGDNITPMWQLKRDQRIAQEVAPVYKPNYTPMGTLADIQHAQASGMTPYALLQNQQDTGQYNPLVDMITKKTLEDELGDWINIAGQTSA